MIETDTIIYNDIREVIDKLHKILVKEASLNARLCALDKESSEITDQLDVYYKMGNYYNELVHRLMSLLSEEYESIAEEIEKEKEMEEETKEQEAEEKEV